MAVPVYFATNRNIIASAVPNNFGTDFNADGDLDVRPRRPAIGQG